MLHYGSADAGMVDREEVELECYSLMWHLNGQCQMVLRVEVHQNDYPNVRVLWLGYSDYGLIIVWCTGANGIKWQHFTRSLIGHATVGGVGNGINVGL